MLGASNRTFFSRELSISGKETKLLMKQAQYIGICQVLKDAVTSSCSTFLVK